MILKLYYNSFDEALRIKQKEIRKQYKNNIYIINYVLNKVNGDLCGFCIHLYIPNINANQIDYIAIDKHYQGMGLAKLLFTYIYDTYCHRKILTLECENHLIKFYEKLGCNLINLPYEVGCQKELKIMVKGAHKNSHRIVQSIKSINDYSGARKVIIITLKCPSIPNICLVENEINPYNYFTKEEIS